MGNAKIFDKVILFRIVETVDLAQLHILLLDLSLDLSRMLIFHLNFS